MEENVKEKNIYVYITSGSYFYASPFSKRWTNVSDGLLLAQH